MAGAAYLAARWTLFPYELAFSAKKGPGRDIPNDVCFQRAQELLRSNITKYLGLADYPRIRKEHI
jgi:hypothetical protein